MLISSNYFSPENQLKYMGSSQYKAFLKCEETALAEIKGEYRREETTALLVGSYVDAYYEGTLERYKETHSQIMTQKGALKSEYRHAEYIIKRAERDKKFSQYMSGEKQVIMTGEIAGVPFKIKIDSYHPDKCIVDLKCVKDFEPIWNEEKRIKQHFIEYWGYLEQGAIYQEIVRQNTGKTLPFFIAAITKEKEPDLELFHLKDDYLQDKLYSIQQLAPRFQKIKNGELKPQRCGKCDHCRYTKILTSPIEFTLTTEE